MKKIFLHIIPAAFFSLSLLTACGNADTEETTLVTIERTERETGISYTLPEEESSMTGTQPFSEVYTETSVGSAEISVPDIMTELHTAEVSEVITDSEENNITVSARNLLSSEGGSNISEVLPSEELQTASVEAVYSGKYHALNYPVQSGMWFSYLEYDRVMKGQSKEEFTRLVEEAFDNMASIGINTVYVHLRPFGDAYYNSEIFPRGDRLTGSYDPLEIMVKAAHDRGLSIHGWINPMRLMTDSSMKSLSNTYIIKQWYDSGKNMYEYDSRWYLDPSSGEVRELICSGVREIISKYNVDGIQIDDYFYPTADLDWDIKSYENSDKALSHGDFRRNAVTEMVKGIYRAVHSENSSAVFGIAPSGNAEADYSTLYADVELWCGSSDCCDYICPQIYYGLEHESYPFEETLVYWKNMCCADVSTVAGIAAYKAGQTDNYAGRGKNEWIDNSDIVWREMETAKKYGCGTALFRYDSLFETKGAAEKELEAIKVNK